MQTDLILIGGFLGAGKTTFLRAISGLLTAKGKKVGLITNDQATALVDTAFLRNANDNVLEVSGSCFCCNYKGFMEAVAKLRETGMDTIIAEPVGSCTDLSATTMQPLKETSASNYKIYPLSVFCDPYRLNAILNNGFSGLHPSAVYIVLKQLEEADLIVINKADLLTVAEMEQLIAKTKIRFPDKPILALSANTGEGFEAWLTAINAAECAGKIIANVDYDIYAEGEAVLGWLNMAVALEKPGANWNSFADALLNSLANEFDNAGLSVAHIKIMLESNGEAMLGNITGVKTTTQRRNAAGNGNKAALTINARVETAPETLLRMVQDILTRLCAENGIAFKVETSNCLSPGRPKPTYRYTNIINKGSC